jgi:hypothetical protein
VLICKKKQFLTNAVAYFGTEVLTVVYRIPPGTYLELPASFLLLETSAFAFPSSKVTTRLAAQFQPASQTRNTNFAVVNAY